MPRRRPPRDVWDEARRDVWERDGRRCTSPLQAPVCQGKPSIRLEEAHCDHLRSGKLAGNERSNLRTLCRPCHVLRMDFRHRGMIANALRDGIIPANWRDLLWEDPPRR